MAVSIDTVYQRVLALANKEQRGYITPQQFNLFANHAQQEIFEQYFYDLNALKKQRNTSGEFSDMIRLLEEKISIFERERGGSWVATNMPIVATNVMSIPRDEIYRIGTVRIGSNQVEMLSSKDFDAARMNPLTKPTLKRPIGYMTSLGLSISTGQLITHANVGTIHNSNINLSWIAQPPQVSWGYVVVNESALYDSNPAKTTNFLLHASDEPELIHKILKLSGVHLRAPELVQMGAALEKSETGQQINKQ